MKKNPIGKKWKATPRWIEVYTLYAQHRITQQVASQMLNCHYNTVYRNFKRIETEMFPLLADHVAQVKVGQTNTLRHVIEQAQAAFDKSLEDYVVEHEREASGNVYKERTKQKGAGNAQFLQVIRGALDDIRKIWGADAPQKVDVVAQVSDVSNDTGTRLEAIAKRMQQLVPEVRHEVIEAKVLKPIDATAVLPDGTNVNLGSKVGKVTE